MSWKDYRLAYNTSLNTKCIYYGRVATEKLKNIWWPHVQIINAFVKRHISNKQLSIYPNGTVEYIERFHAKIHVNYMLHDLPWDTQNIELNLSSFPWNNKQVIFRGLAKNNIEYKSHMHFFGWNIATDPYTESRNVKIHSHDSDHSVFSIKFSIKRSPGFYLFKFISPLGSLMLLASLSFWLRSSLGLRIIFSLSVLSLVVLYEFIIISRVPSIVYLKNFDKFVGWTYFSILVSVIFNIYSVRRSTLKKKYLTEGLDSWLRYIIPIVYIVISVLIFSFRINNNNKGHHNKSMDIKRSFTHHNS